jgi:hypothetical protein
MSSLERGDGRLEFLDVVGRRRERHVLDDGLLREGRAADRSDQHQGRDGFMHDRHPVSS